MNSIEKAFKIVAEKHNITEELVEKIYKSFFKQLRHEITFHPYVKIHLTNFGSMIPEIKKIRKIVSEYIRRIRKGSHLEEHYRKEISFYFKIRHLITANNKIKSKKRYDGRTTI